MGILQALGMAAFPDISSLLVRLPVMDISLALGMEAFPDISLLLARLPVMGILPALGMEAFPDISSLPGILPVTDNSLAWGASPDNSWIQSKRGIWINPVVSLEWVLTGFSNSLPDQIPEAYLDESLYPDIRTYQVP